MERILASALFSRSERLSQFLRFAVEATLRGETEQLKESLIGMKVYSRDPGYDPKLEPIVRTEARRLRAKLKQYYEGPGESDRVVISLPTGGYSIHVEMLPELSPTVVAMPVRVARPRTWRERSNLTWLMSLAALLGVAAAAGGYFYFRSSSRSSSGATPTVTPIAAYPGAEFEPSVSPDGKKVAFVWDQEPGRFNIYTKTIGSENAARLTDSHSPTHDLFPAWSPDGNAIAFVRASPGKKELLIASLPQGGTRRIGEFYASSPEWVPDASVMDWSPGPAWSRDGKSLAITDRVDGQRTDSLYLLSPENGEKRKLTAPAATDVGDYAPAFSPDGRSLAFIRLASQRGISDVYVLSLGNRSQKRVTFDAKRVSGLSWLSDNEIAFSSNRSGPNALWRVSTGGGQPRPIFGAGLHITNPTVLPGGRALIYTQAFRNTYIWRADLTRSNAGSAVRFIGSQGLNDSAQYSADGRRIAWVSDRSGTREIWIANADASDARQLTHFGGLPVGTPRWSPDSRQIVFDSVREGRSAIYIVAVDAGKPRLFVADADDDMMPSWSHDGHSIYFLSHRGETLLETWKKPVSGGTETRVTKSGGGEVLETPDGKAIYYSRFRGGIWQLTQDGTESPLPGLADIKTSRYFAMTSLGIYYLVREDAPWVIAFYSFKTGKTSSVLSLDKPPEFGTPSLSVSPDGRFAIFSELEQSGTNLQLLRDF